mgnify:CR=1 FL=1
MKKLAIALVLAIGLSGCQSLLQFAADTSGISVVTEDARQKAYKGASLAFTAWQGIQQGVLKVGQLPRCTEAVKLLCVSQDTWERIKDIEGQTSATLLAVRPAITAEGDIELLLAIPAIVHDAKISIDKEVQK